MAVREQQGRMGSRDSRIHFQTERIDVSRRTVTLGFGSVNRNGSAGGRSVVDDEERRSIGGRLGRACKCRDQGRDGDEDAG